MKKLLIILLLILLQGCQGQKDDRIQVIVQPILELNTTNGFKILFKGLTNKDSIQIPKARGLELNDSPSINQITIKGENYLEYSTYIKATEVGVLKLPTIQADINGKETLLSPFTIKVVEKMANPSSNDILLKLSSNKEKYTLKDTVIINLYEYSRFNLIYKKAIKKDSIQNLMPNITSEQNNLKVELKSNSYQISGIENFEKYIENNFSVVDFDWDPFRSTSVMENINGKKHIKTLLFTISLVPKSTGGYAISPSKFKYRIYKSDSDYYSYWGEYDSVKTFEIKSEKLRFRVK